MQQDLDRLISTINQRQADIAELLARIKATLLPEQITRALTDIRKTTRTLQRFKTHLATYMRTSDASNKKGADEMAAVVDKKLREVKIQEYEVKALRYSGKQVSKDKDRVKAEPLNWIITSILILSSQADKFQLELRLLDTIQKKSADVLKQQLLETRFERHWLHIGRLDKIYRKVEEDQVPATLMAPIRANVNYYINNNQSPNFEENPSMYPGFKHFDSDSEGSSFGSEGEVSETKKNYPYNPAASLKGSFANSLKNEHDRSKNIVASANRQSTPPSDFLQLDPSQKASAWFSSPTHQINKKIPVTGNPDPAYLDAANLSDSKASAQTGPDKPSDPPPRSSQTMPFEAIEFSQLKSSLEALRDEQIKNFPSKIVFFQHALENASINAPDIAERECRRAYTPEQPFQTPSYFPQECFGIFENPLLFERFDIDTLFFIFYYRRNTIQQYFAARELKRHAWRFHKRYMTWFQRHDEPTIITETYEQGNYIYFDYEKTWLQRRKVDFKFEYRYLEDVESPRYL